MKAVSAGPRFAAGTWGKLIVRIVGVQLACYVILLKADK